jgi:ankyrin repeat protein
MVSFINEQPVEQLLLIFNMFDEIKLLKLRLICHKWKDLIEINVFKRDRKISFEESIIEMNYYHFSRLKPKELDRNQKILISLSGSKIFEKIFEKIYRSAIDSYAMDYYIKLLTDDLAKKGLLSVLKFVYEKKSLYVSSNSQHTMSSNIRHAIESGHLHVVKFLMEHPLREKNVLQSTMNNFLETAVDCDKNEIVICLIEHGANIHYRNDYAFRKFVADGNTMMLKQLYEHGANPGALKWISLEIALKNDKIDTVMYLLNLITDKSKIKSSVLRWCAEKNRLDIIKLFVQMNIDIHLDHECALRYASRCGFIEIVRYLLDLGADPLATKGDGNAIQWSYENGWLEINKLLLEAVSLRPEPIVEEIDPEPIVEEIDPEPVIKPKKNIHRRKNKRSNRK